MEVNLKSIITVAILLYILRNIFIAPILNKLDDLLEEEKSLTDLLGSGKIVINFKGSEKK